MRTAPILIISFFFSLFIVLFFSTPSQVLAEGPTYPCNRPNQISVGTPTNNYQCAYTSNGCRNTAYTQYVNTTDNNNDGSADPNDPGDQPWCDYNCAAPANVSCQSNSSGGGQNNGGSNNNSGGNSNSGGGSCTDPGGNSLPSNMSGSDQSCVISVKGAGVLGSIASLLNGNGYNASGCTQGQLLTKWCDSIDTSGCQQAKTSCSSSGSGSNNNQGNSGNSSSNSSSNSLAPGGTSNTVTVKVGNPGASSGNCNGMYALGNPIGNFGDPNCNFSKDAVFSILQQSDSASANFWFYSVVPCESGYNPNAYNPYAVDPAGAFGLFQMGRGRNGQYDHGDVEWHTQPTNAVSYKNLVLGGSFAYWACAH